MKVIRFTASWCAPCKALAKTLEEVSTDIEIEVEDIDDENSRANVYGIRSVPTLIMLDDNGQEVKRLIGLKPKDILEEWLNG